MDTSDTLDFASASAGVPTTGTFSELVVATADETVKTTFFTFQDVLVTNVTIGGGDDVREPPFSPTYVQALVHMFGGPVDRAQENAAELVATIEEVIL